jgi:hypothetical protein
MAEELGPTIASRSFFGAGDESETPVVKVEVCKPLPSPHLLTLARPMVSGCQIKCDQKNE